MKRLFDIACCFDINCLQKAGKFFLLICLVCFNMLEFVQAQGSADTLQAEAWLKEARKLINTHQYEDGMQLLIDAGQLYQQTQNEKGYCLCEYGIGQTLRRQRKFEAASNQLKKTLNYCEPKLGEKHKVIGDMYNEMGITTYFNGFTTEAIQYMKQSLNIRKSLPAGLTPRVAGAYINLSNLYRHQGNFDSAAYCNLTGIKILLDSGHNEHRYLINGYNNLGNYYCDLGNYREGKKYHQLVLDHRLKTRGEEDGSTIGSYDNLGICYYRLGDLDYGKVLLQKAANLAEKYPGQFDSEVTPVFRNLGSLYQESGEYALSLKYIQKDLDKTRQVYGENHIETAFAYTGLAVLYKNMGQLEQALELFEKAIEILPKLDNPINYFSGTMYFRMASCLREMGRLKEATIQAEEGLRQFQVHFSGETNSKISSSLPQLIQLYLEQGKAEEALESIHLGYRGLIENYKGSHWTDTPGQRSFEQAQLCWPILLRHAQLLKNRATKDATVLQSALELALLSVEVVDSAYNRFLSPNSRKEDQEDILSVYSFAIDLLFQMYESDGNEAWLARAFELSDQSKSRLLRLALMDRRARSFAGISDSLLEREYDLLAEMDFYEKKLNTFHEDESEAEKYVYWEKKYVDLREDYQNLILQLERAHPRYFQLKYQKIYPDLSSIQKALPDQATTLMSFFWSEKQLYQFVLTPKGLKARKIAWDEEKQSDLEAFLGMVKNRKQIEEEGLDSAYIHQFVNQSFEWYQLLLEPVLSTESQRIMIVPDAYLSYLPFEVLLTQKPENHPIDYRNLAYLFRDYAISYRFQASFLSQSLNGESKASETYLGFAPAYQPAVSVESDSLSFYAVNRNAFGPLTHNQEEVEESARIWNGMAYLGEQATKENFLKEASNYQMLHLAMHAYVHDQDPRYDALVFAGKDSAILEAHEIYQIPLSADVAILSACNTGLGQWQQGEGIMSLARAFRYAGCPSITMSLWLADDQASAQLIEAFQTQLKAGLDKDEALRMAKLKVLEKHPLAHPFFWAAFIQTGDIGPIQGKNNLWSVYLFIGLLGLLGFFFWRKRTHTMNS